MRDHGFVERCGLNDAGMRRAGDQRLGGEPKNDERREDEERDAGETEVRFAMCVRGHQAASSVREDDTSSSGNTPGRATLSGHGTAGQWEANHALALR